MIDSTRRAQVLAELDAATLRLTRSLSGDVEVQSFGFGMRLVPPDEGLILGWFLPPGHDELVVSVTPTDDWWREEPSWCISAAAPDAVDHVVRLLRAGLAGQITVQCARRRSSATAHLHDGPRTTESAPPTVVERLLRGRQPAEIRHYPPFATGIGHVRRVDVASPPPLLDDLVGAIAPTVDAAGLVLERTFVAEGIHGLPSDGGASFGWGAQVTRPDSSDVLWVWFDGFDEDLAVMVAQRHWFAWVELDDSATVVDEAAQVITAAIAGRITPGPRNTATAHLPDGRSIATTPPPPPPRG